MLNSEIFHQKKESNFLYYSINLVCSCFPYHCRSLFVVLGVGGFVVSKNSVDKKRYESMKVRERMRKSNDGDYEDFQDTKRFDI